MPELQFVRAGGFDVACRLEGPADAPAVLLVHGILASSRVWDGVAERLSDEWRVIRYDLRGHGATAATPPPYTMEVLAGDAIALLDALAVGQAHFVGTSLGGMIGQVLGAHHADRLLSLTLANTTATQGFPKAWEERSDVALSKGVQTLVEPTLQRWFTRQCLERDFQVIETMRSEALRTSVDGFVGCAHAIQHLDQRELLGIITAQTLVIAGQSDTATPPADSEFLHREIRRSRLVVLPAAHQTAAECPDLFVAAWKNFNAQHDIAPISGT